MGLFGLTGITFWSGYAFSDISSLNPLTALLSSFTAMSAYSITCYVVKYLFNKTQPTNEMYEKYLLELVNNTEKFNDIFDFLETVHQSNPSDVSMCLLSDKLTSIIAEKYIHLPRSNPEILIKLLAYASDDTKRDVYKKYAEKMKRKRAMITGVMVTLGCEPYMGRDVRVIEKYLEEEMAVLQERYHKMQGYLSQVGLGQGEIPQQIMQYEGHEAARNRMFTYIPQTKCVSETFRLTFYHSSIYKLAQFYIDSNYRDFHKVMELLPCLPEEQRGCLISSMQRYPLQWEGIIPQLPLSKEVKELAQIQKLNRATWDKYCTLKGLEAQHSRLNVFLFSGNEEWLLTARRHQAVLTALHAVKERA